MARRRSPLAKKTLPVVVLTAVLLLAGCSVTVVDGEPDPEAIGELAEESYEEVASYSATVTLYTDGERRAVEEIVAVPHDGKQYVETVASGGESAEMVSVSNGSIAWLYRPEENAVQRLERPDSLDETSYSDVIAALVETSDISYEGTDTVDDRETDVVTVVPDDGNGEEMTYWIDRETHFPVKYELTPGADSDETAMTVEYTDLAFDVDPDPELFEFEPPADAEIEETDVPSVERYDSIERAERATGLDAPDPAMPDGYAVERISGTFENDGEDAELSLGYENGDEPVTVATATRMDDLPDDSDPVSVNGRDGAYAEVADIAILTWSCDGIGYRITGPADEELLTTIGESIDC